MCGLPANPALALALMTQNSSYIIIVSRRLVHFVAKKLPSEPDSLAVAFVAAPEHVLGVSLSDIQCVIMKARLAMIEHPIPPPLVGSHTVLIIGASASDEAFLEYGTGEI